MTSFSGGQRSAAWHVWRREGIGSSDAPVIMGLSPYKDIRDLYLEKIGEKSPDAFVNKHMQRGIDLEPRAREMVCARLDIKLFPRELEHPQYPHLRASLDAACLDDSLLVEIKCPEKKNHLEIKENGCPRVYYCQIQHQLLVSGIQKAFLASFIEEGETFDLHLVPVERDDNFIGEMFHKEQAFWECVQTRTPPADALLAPESWVVNTSKEWCFLAEEYRRVKEQRDYLDVVLERLKQALVAQSKGMKTKGGGVQITFRQRNVLDKEELERELRKTGLKLDDFEYPGRPYPILEIK